MSKCLPTWYFLITKSKTVTILEKPWQMSSWPKIKINSSSNRNNWQHVPPDIMHQEDTTSPLGSPCQEVPNLNLIWKHHTNPKWKTVYKITGLHSSNIWMSYFTILNERRQDNNGNTWSWVFFCYKGHYSDTVGKNLDKVHRVD